MKHPDMIPMTGVGVWSNDVDPAAIHAFVCESDLYHLIEGQEAPERKLETTEDLVRSKSVWALSDGSRIFASFTLRFEVSDGLTHATLRRATLAVHLLEYGSVIGIQCVRLAIEVARSANARFITCETNPGLKSHELLSILGFREVARGTSSDGLPFVSLRKDLTD